MNRFGSNSFENENDQFAENQRVGRLLAENNPRPWNETYNPQGTYQSRHHGHPNYLPDYSSGTQPHYGYSSQPYYGPQQYGYEQHFYAGAHNDYPANDPGWRHHDDTIWTERNAYKDDDFRYRSGHRNYWHEDYDDKYEADRHPRHRRHPESFFEHIGEGIREGWNNLFHRNPEHRDERHEDDYSNRYAREERHWPESGYTYLRNETNQHQARQAERFQDEQRRYEHEQRRRNQSSDWHNAGPDHRDEDFFDSRNFRG